MFKRVVTWQHPKFLKKFFSLTPLVNHMGAGPRVAPPLAAVEPKYNEGKKGLALCEHQLETSF